MAEDLFLAVSVISICELLVSVFGLLVSSNFWMEDTISICGMVFAPLRNSLRRQVHQTKVGALHLPGMSSKDIALG